MKTTSQIISGSCLRLALALVFAIGLSKMALSDVVVYDQSSIVNGGPLGGSISDHRTAEQFVLSDPTKVTGFSIFLAELGSFNIEGVFEGFTGLGWAVFDGNSAPANLKAFGTVDPGDGTLTDTFVNNGPNDVFRFDFNIPDLQLEAGDFWLALVEPDWGHPHDGIAISWFTTNQPLDGDYRQELFTKSLGNVFNTVYTGQGLAFQVHGNTIPEPGTMGLLAGCLMAATFYRRKK